jgi:hypothetical protein
MQFAQVFPEQAIVVALIRQLSWTKILALIPIKNGLKRTFYVEMAQLEHWSSRQLQERISSQLFERTFTPKTILVISVHPRLYGSKPLESSRRTPANQPTIKTESVAPIELRCC